MDFNYQRGNKEIHAKINELIRVPKVLVVDQSGNNLGELDTNEARRLATEAELDLVEVNPNSNPPVWRIMDYQSLFMNKTRN
jgi:translation initiation factor IF-3